MVSYSSMFNWNWEKNTVAIWKHWKKTPGEEIYKISIESTK